MSTSRRLVLGGFPLLFVLLLLCLYDLAGAGARSEFRLRKDAAAAEAERTVEMADRLLRVQEMEALRTRERARLALEDEQERRADRAAVILSSELRNLSSDWTLLPRLLLMPGPAEETGIDTAPLEAVRRSQERLAAVVAEKEGVIGLSDAMDTLLWQSPGKVEAASARPAVRELSFEWRGEPRLWRLRLLLAGESLPPLPTLAERADRLAATPVLRERLGAETTLEVTDMRGVRRIALPAGRALIEELAADAFGAWREVEDTNAERYLAGRFPTDETPWGLAAETRVMYRGGLARLGAWIAERPALLLLPLAAFALATGAAAWAWKTRGSRARTGGLRLVPQRGVAPPFAAEEILYADLDHGGEPFGVRPARRVSAAAPAGEGESNLLRLRRLYRGDGAGSFDLESQVRSDLLKTLLDRVGGSAQSRAPEGDNDGV